MWKEKNNKLQKTFKFNNFNEAWEFMKQVAELAEKMNHHPWWSNEYSWVEIHLSTHDVGNSITEKDYQLAKLIDAISLE